MALTGAQLATVSPRASEARIDRLALHRQDAGSALVAAVQGVSAREPFERLDPERELAERHRALRPQASIAEALEVLGGRVIRPVDDPEIFGASAFHGGLD